VSIDEYLWIALVLCVLLVFDHICFVCAAADNRNGKRSDGDSLFDEYNGHRRIQVSHFKLSVSVLVSLLNLYYVLIIVYQIH
jgi:hypothetical protein